MYLLIGEGKPSYPRGRFPNIILALFLNTVIDAPYRIEISLVYTIDLL